MPDGPKLTINKRAEDELNNLRPDSSDDSSFVNIILLAVYGRGSLVTQSESLKPLTSRIRNTQQYTQIRGNFLNILY